MTVKSLKIPIKIQLQIRRINPITCKLSDCGDSIRSIIARASNKTEVMQIKNSVTINWIFEMIFLKGLLITTTKKMPIEKRLNTIMVSNAGLRKVFFNFPTFVVYLLQKIRHFLLQNRYYKN